MPLMERTYCLLIALLLIGSGSEAQSFSDLGVLSGSGLTVLPTATVIPNTEFRAQWSRVEYVKDNRKGMNVIGLGIGLSTNLEAYMRLTSEQVGVMQSELAYGFGGKFQLPVLVPLLRRVAIWGEQTTSDQVSTEALFPSDAIRAGLIATVDSNVISPTMMAGFSRIGVTNQVLLGAGATVALGNRAQMGLEVMYGYLDLQSLQAAVTASARVFPNVSLHVSPGYIKTSSVSMWSVTFGVSLTTADIDFYPRVVDAKPDEYKLPSIDEIEQESSNVPAGGGSSDGASPPQPAELPEERPND